jgi:hypothetical protein
MIFLYCTQTIVCVYISQNRCLLFDAMHGSLLLPPKCKIPSQAAKHTHKQATADYNAESECYCGKLVK